MPTVDFLFWIVTQRRGLISLPVEPDKGAGFNAAFSAAGGAAKYMASRGETMWENRLVSRSTFASLMADLRRSGVQGLCLDPTKDGYGAKVAFDEMAF